MLYLSRRELCGGLVAATVLNPIGVSATTSKTIFMVLWRGETEVEKGFRGHFEQLDQPVDIIVRSVERDADKVKEIVEEIKSVGPDLVYSWGTSVTLAIAGRDPDLSEGPDDYPPQITDIPVLFTMVSQPIKSRIIKEFGPTGRNVTGVSHLVPLETQFEAMQAYMPVDRISIIFTPTETNSMIAADRLVEIGQRMNVRVDQFPVPNTTDGSPDPEALPSLISEASASGAQFLYLGPDSFLGQYAQRVTDLANALQLPSFASVERMLSASDALYGLVARYQKVGQFTATKAERILFGNEDPANIPVELLPEFSYLIRSDVARKLNIYPSLALMDYAETIEP
ncbi:MAG: ABC transporter substrate-binding protein [Aestuariivita sp.]|nr:ABC transporter substrate-binding protein [Aestuariivita sp.]MCY4203584.1 ABC transporter substrate-binding protein [Aestuariivita sp.]MCY4288920.1 ABC transporter substrate-binding protein [Aestuariivita sp.]MCY4346161.1 ABC transporter substrate-binding protein [Aestuariivita sp.]